MRTHLQRQGTMLFQLAQPLLCLQQRQGTPLLRLSQRVVQLLLLLLLVSVLVLALSSTTAWRNSAPALIFALRLATSSTASDGFTGCLSREGGERGHRGDSNQLR